MKLRQGSDAILVGINTILADNPSLTVRRAGNTESDIESRSQGCDASCWIHWRGRR